MRVDTDVLIVGAGPAGLVLAAVLAQQGVDFRIVDSKAGPTKESRAAIVHVRTLELLDRLGLADRAVAQGVQTTRVEIYEGGKCLSSFPLAGRGIEAQTPYPFALGLGQDQTERLLVEHLTAGGRAVDWDTELVAVTVGGQESIATVRHIDATETTISARWVVGADGARSPVRHALGIRFTGSTFGQTGLLADVELDLADADALPGGTLRLNLTRGGFVGIIGLRNGRHRLFGAVPPSFAPPGSGDDVSHEAYAEAVPADIQRWLDEYFAMDARIRHTAWTALFRIHSRIADRFRTGNVFLVGDAAHIHSPAGGQGMNLAIGDAVNLGWKLALVTNGHAHARLLDSYEAERRPVARTVLRGSDRGFALETTSNPILGWVRTHLASRLIGPLTRLRPVRAAVFNLFAQTWIRYPHSPAIATERGPRFGPRPGDRAPYGHVEPTDGLRPASVFDVCGGLRHHVMVFEGLVCDSATSARRHDVERLVGRYAVDIDVHLVAAPNRILHARYGARGPRLVLIRPDGHLAYTGELGDTRRLGAYLDQFYIRH